MSFSDLNSISESLKKTRKLQKEDSKLFNSNFAAHNEYALTLILIKIFLILLIVILFSSKPY